MDALTKLFNEWLVNHPEGSAYEAFQSGLTTGAVSMRTRALASVTGDINKTKNAIGQLSDIPNL